MELHGESFTEDMHHNFESMVAKKFNHKTPTNEEIIRHCAWCTTHRYFMYKVEGGHSVVRLSQDAVVKYGFSITQEEAANQMRAYDLIDQRIVRIPLVFRFFAHMSVGYIVMEFIDGEPLSSTDAQAPNDIARVLAYFSQIHSNQPGPLGGGIARGLLWIECDWISPTSADAIEEYFNTRQLQHRQKLDLTGQQFCLCHLDIALRNFLRLSDGSLCLLDWASAGFYPRFFEICALRLNVWTQNDCVSKVLELVGNLEQNEDNQARLLQQAHYLGQKYVYGPSSRRKKIKLNSDHVKA